MVKVLVTGGRRNSRSLIPVLTPCLGNSFVGVPTIKELVASGYTVEATVRSEAKAARTNAILTPDEASKTTFRIIPDMTPDGAFDELMTPEALKSGGLKVHLSLAEFPPNGVRQQSASTVLVTQHGRGLPCAGLVGSNTYCIQCRIAIDSLKKIWTFVVKFTPSRASVSSPEADGRHDSQS